jgi:protein involved in polysaccharide export with SLBB domain
MHHHRSIALLVVVAVLAGGGCSTAPKHNAASAPADPPSNNSRLAQLESGRLYPGDEVVMFIEENPPTMPSSLRIDRTVQADGTVALVSNKIFTATGKMLGEFKREVRSYYVPKLFKSVTIWGPLEPTSYYVGGEVRSPGRLLWEGRTTLLKAIAGRGGFTPSANKKKVQLIRAGGERRIVNCTNISRPEEDVEVLGGDFIIVPRSSKWPFR